MISVIYRIANGIESKKIPTKMPCIQIKFCVRTTQDPIGNLRAKKDRHVGFFFLSTPGSFTISVMSASMLAVWAMVVVLIESLVESIDCFCVIEY